MTSRQHLLLLMTLVVLSIRVQYRYSSHVSHAFRAGTPTPTVPTRPHVHTRSTWSRYAGTASIPRQHPTTGTVAATPNEDDQTTISADASRVSDFQYALLFDCDGVILETEELHRLAYNAAFRHFHLRINNEPVIWDVEYYDQLQNTVGGGKPKMFYYFRTTMEGQFPSYRTDADTDVDTDADQPQLQLQPPPVTEQEQKALIDQLQDYKTHYFTTLLETKATARPGVLELMDEALNDPTIAVGVCSAATKAAAVKTLDITLGPQRVQRLNVCILGDDVSTKKPDPLIYNTACQRLNLSPSQCVVIEDSLVGLRAAVAAQMKCIITYTSSTADQDFYKEGAMAKVPDLGSRNVNLEAIFGPLRTHGNDAELLVGLKD